MLIRPETPADFPALHQFIKTAFETAKVSDGTEQDFVNKLRAGENYVPELALMAEEDGRMIGHIMLTKTQILTPDHNGQTVLILAPLSVLLAARGRGVGALLVREAFKRARALGYGACVLVGDPAYYGRFGFEAMDRFGLKCKQEIPPQYTLAYELLPGALKNAAGTVDFLG